MYAVYLFNTTSVPITVSGHKGSDWISAAGGADVESVYKDAKTVNPGCYAVVALMSPSYTGNPHWGWLYLSVPQQKDFCQLYISAPSTKEIVDYAVQRFNDGENRDGTSLSSITIPTIGEVPVAVDLTGGGTLAVFTFGDITKEFDLKL